jgi:hypothetical protein
MSSSQKSIPRWLVLLMILFVLGIGSAGSAFQRMDKAFLPLRAESPSVENALIYFKLLTGAAVCFSLYGASLIYRRERGTLGMLKVTLIGRSVFIIAAGFCVPIIAKLPPERTNPMFVQAAWGSLSSVIFAGLWITYLSCSNQVREIYGSIENVTE